MDVEYLRDSMLINIEREYAEGIVIDKVIDEFNTQKNRRVQLKWCKLTSFTFIYKLVLFLHDLCICWFSASLLVYSFLLSLLTQPRQELNPGSAPVSPLSL